MLLVVQLSGVYYELARGVHLPCEALFPRDPVTGKDADSLAKGDKLGLSGVWAVIRQSIADVGQVGALAPT